MENLKKRGGEKVGREPHNFAEHCGHLQQQEGLR